AVEEASLGEEIKVRVGGKAIGAESDPDTPSEEVPKRMWRMAERGVRPRTVDDAAVWRNRGIRREVVPVNVQHGPCCFGKSQDVVRAPGQSTRVPDAALGQEGDERAGVPLQQFQFGR